VGLGRRMLQGAFETTWSYTFDFIKETGPERGGGFLRDAW
jgi:hypothetical protein